MVFRLLKMSELGFLEEMLYEAIFIPEGIQKPPKTIIKDPSLSAYYEKWGEDVLDIALVAEFNQILVGAIWGRRFKKVKSGFGYIDDETPELSMAVKTEYRNRGIGTELLKEIIEIYKDKGIKTLSLSVDKRNAAYRLYAKIGFRIFSEKDTTATMCMQLT